MDDLRKDCQMRHENGNCTVIGGFCTAVNDPICEGLHSAYDSGYRAAAIRAQHERENPKPVTNADLIRAMSDEELSKFLHEPFCDKRTHEECTISYCGVCDQCVLDWLQQPAEEG